MKSIKPKYLRLHTIEEIQEMQANAFAMELLMPEDKFRAVVGSMEIDVLDDNDIGMKRLIALFQVPKATIIARMIDLDMLSI